MADELHYKPYDQAEKLSPPPWKPEDPALIAWERAHGHDVRLACYVGDCAVAEAELERERDEARAALVELEAEVRRLVKLGTYAGHPALVARRVAVSPDEAPRVFALLGEGE